MKRCEINLFTGEQTVRDMTAEEIAELEAQAAQIVPRIPQVVSRFQARAALHLAGLLDDVETLMAAPETPVLAKLAWADAQEFKRNSPSLLGIAGALALTDDQLDDLFTTAAGIEA